MVKRKVYDSLTGMDTLRVTRISQDQAWQRTGRAGRESEGVCYRAYTMDEYRTMSSASMPEILRSNIAATVRVFRYSLHKLDSSAHLIEISIRFTGATVTCTRNKLSKIRLFG